MSWKNEIQGQRESSRDPELKAEAQHVLDMFKKADQEAYFSKEFNQVYIVSSHWLNQWKAYTGFHELTGESIGLATGGVRPGPVDSTDLMEQSQRHLRDPHPSKAYTNITLKNDLTEGENYAYVSRDLWAFFCEKYGKVNEIKRYVICTNDEKNTCMVEVRLKKVSI
jgi:DUSP domain